MVWGCDVVHLLFLLVSICTWAGLPRSYEGGPLIHPITVLSSVRLNPWICLALSAVQNRAGLAGLWFEAKKKQLPHLFVGSSYSLGLSTSEFVCKLLVRQLWYKKYCRWPFSLFSFLFFFEFSKVLSYYSYNVALKNLHFLIWQSNVGVRATAVLTNSGFCEVSNVCEDHSPYCDVCVCRAYRKDMIIHSLRKYWIIIV